MSAPTTLREAEIRPDHLVQEQQAAFERDIARVLARQEEFLHVSCPACDASEGPEVWRKYGFTYRGCPQCETVYISPRPSPAVLDMYYSTSENYEFWNKHIFPASEATRRERIFRPRAERVVEICRRHGVSTGAILDVGAGFGTFLEEVRALGAFERIVAVEPTPSLVRTCRERGLEVIDRPIEQVELEGGAFDVVTSFEVIEHLFRPSEYVRQCARVLKPGGILILTCPNVKGFDVMVLREGSNAVDPEHLNYFHPASLSRLVSGHGFEVLEIQTPGKLDAELVRKRALSGEFDLSGQPFLKHVLLDEWERLGDRFQAWIAESGLSSHMWLVARRAAGG
jgi:2-polyprenyl-3-methyl-5-hydroxy-6-metoxy-1,4-benzoquinol methylase